MLIPLFVEQAMSRVKTDADLSDMEKDLQKELVEEVDSDEERTPIPARKRKQKKVEAPRRGLAVKPVSVTPVEVWGGDEEPAADLSNGGRKNRTTKTSQYLSSSLYCQ